MKQSPCTRLANIAVLLFFAFFFSFNGRAQNPKVIIPKNAIYLVDGVLLDEKDFDITNTADFKQVDIFFEGKPIRHFGGRDRKGLVVIATTRGVKKSAANAYIVANDNKINFEGIFKLPKEHVRYLTVMESAAAQRQYGAAAQFGAVIFTLTHAEEAQNLPVEKQPEAEIAGETEAKFEKTFTKVEKPASFPGGVEGWKKYLEENLRYPKKAFKRNTSGVVRIQFVVDKDGSISDIVALSNAGDGLEEEGIRILKNSPNWIPAEQDGRKVKHRTIQTITFRLE